MNHYWNYDQRLERFSKGQKARFLKELFGMALIHGEGNESGWLQFAKEWEIVGKYTKTIIVSVYEEKDSESLTVYLRNGRHTPVLKHYITEEEIKEIRGEGDENETN